MGHSGKPTHFMIVFYSKLRKNYIVQNIQQKVFFLLTTAIPVHQNYVAYSTLALSDYHAKKYFA